MLPNLNDASYSYSYSMAADNIDLGDEGWIFQMDYDDSEELDVSLTGTGDTYEYTMTVTGGEEFTATVYLIGADDNSLLFQIAEGSGTDYDGEYWLVSTTELEFEGEWQEYVIPAVDGGYVPCFVTGTRIQTPEGERAVETLAIGDLVTTAEGKAVPVKWVGRRRIALRFVDARMALPVRIAAGALGDNVPARDLYVSPDHALLVDGLLVHALALVNGVSIVQLSQWDEPELEYFHIELEQHELILAEGAPAETFVDNVTRRRFDNHAEYEALYGEGHPVPELPLPRVKHRRQLAARIRQRLMALATGRAVAA